MTHYTELNLNGENRTVEICSFGQAIGLDSLVPNRYSALLLIELYTETILMRRMNPEKVLSEIRKLETGTESPGTKPPSQFKHAPLRGLWHKHYQQDGLHSMAINLQQALKRHGLPWLEQSVRDAREAGEERYLTEEDIQMLVHDAVMGNWLRQAEANRLTGEWIIYAQHEHKNYYLCLGRHGSGDNILRSKIEKICYHEFPFLASVLV